MDQFIIEQISDFSFKNALAFAEASVLAYENEENIEHIVKTLWGFTDFKYINNFGTQGFIAKRSDLILLCFRGTEQEKPEDVLTDIVACQTKTKLGYIHAGFLTALKHSWKDIRKYLKKFHDDNQPLWITGHSLGGALAALAATKLSIRTKEYIIKGVYTYGGPRVGDDTFKALTNSLLPNMYRVTNFKDPVSIVPFDLHFKIKKLSVSVNYKQTGKMLLFTETGDIAKREDSATRVSLIGLTLICLLAAWISKLVKKIKSSEEVTKWLQGLISPHDLVLYKENITKHINICGDDISLL